MNNKSDDAELLELLIMAIHGIAKEEHPTALKIQVQQLSQKLAFMEQSPENRRLVLNEARAMMRMYRDMPKPGDTVKFSIP